MNKNILRTAAALGTCGLLVALPALAQINVTGYTSSGTKVITPAHAINVSGTVHAGVGISGSASSSNTDTGSNTNVNASGSAGSNTSVQAGSPADVVGQAETVINTDVQAQAANAGPQQVELTYASHAKLFGFIPVVIPVHAQAKVDGTVSVQYPWYSFLLATNKTDLHANLPAALQHDLSENTQSSLSAQTQATPLNDMSSVMTNSFDFPAHPDSTPSAQY